MVVISRSITHAIDIKKCVFTHPRERLASNTQGQGFQFRKHMLSYFKNMFSPFPCECLKLDGDLGQQMHVFWGPKFTFCLSYLGVLAAYSRDAVFMAKTHHFKCVLPPKQPIQGKFSLKNASFLVIFFIKSQCLGSKVSSWALYFTFRLFIILIKLHLMPKVSFSVVITYCI